MEMTLRVVHITTVHPRYDTRVFQKECKSLAQAGCDTHLVVADGLGNEKQGGVHIHDIGLRPASRIKRVLRQSFAAARFAVSLKPVIVHLHDPELLLTARYLNRCGIKVVFDAHEDTKRQILRKAYIKPLLRKSIAFLYGLFERFSAIYLNAVIVPQDSMRKLYDEDCRVIVLPNYADIDLFPRRHLDFLKPLIFHAGGLSKDRGLYNMISASTEIKGDFDFKVAGVIAAESRGVDFGAIKYLGSLAFNEVVSLYEESNMGIILYNNVGQYYMANAVKAFEYMANSMPIIMPDFGEWPDFNKRYGCGINVNPTDSKAVAAAVNFLIENPGKARELGLNGRQAIEKEYSWQAVFPRLPALYQEIVID